MFILVNVIWLIMEDVKQNISYCYLKLGVFGQNFSVSERLMEQRRMALTTPTVVVVIFQHHNIN